MKQKTIVPLIVIGFIAAVLSIITSNNLFGTSTEQQTSEVVPVITSEFPTPNSKYFNSQSIDPTQLIQIGTSTNTNPFSNSSQ